MSIHLDDGLLDAVLQVGDEGAAGLVLRATVQALVRLDTHLELTLPSCASVIICLLEHKPSGRPGWQRAEEALVQHRSSGVWLNLRQKG